MRRLLSVYILLLLLFGLIQSIFHPLFLWEELNYHFELFDKRGLMKGSIFLATYLLSVLPFLLLVKLKSTRLFFLLLSILYLFISVDFFIQFLGVTHGFSIDEYLLALHESGNVQYLATYLNIIVRAFILGAIVVVLLYYIRKRLCRARTFGLKHLLLALFPMAIVYGGCYRIDTFKLSGYPAGVKLPLIMVEELRQSEPIKDRTFDTTLEVNSTKRFKNIVWIVDESVTGSYLSLNGYKKETTPYLKALSQQSDSFYNFGLVNSISNCSAQSNLFLRIGLNPKVDNNLEEDMFDLPTIFQYAKEAGFKTWLFDSQTQKDHLQNYLTLYDKSDIDHFETLGSEVSRVERDKMFLDSFSKIINSDEGNNFIVVVKYGAHFPYLLTYNEQETIFKPAVSSSYVPMDFEHKEEQVNTYLNSLYYTTDQYLKEMVSKVNLDSNIIFYTSDHGQNILEVEGLTRTHCNKERIVKNEVTVPLMVFQRDAKRLFKRDKKLFYSQIQLFPTTLELLGYNKQFIKEKYGKTLYDGFEKSSERVYIPASSMEKREY